MHTQSDIDLRNAVLAKLRRIKSRRVTPDARGPLQPYDQRGDAEYDCF